MSFSMLPSELQRKIIQQPSLRNLTDTIHLAGTCRLFRQIMQEPFAAASGEVGINPLQKAVQEVRNQKIAKMTPEILAQMRQEALLTPRIMLVGDNGGIKSKISDAIHGPHDCYSDLTLRIANSECGPKKILRSTKYNIDVESMIFDFATRTTRKNADVILLVFDKTDDKSLQRVIDMYNTDKKYGAEYAPPNTVFVLMPTGGYDDIEGLRSPLNAKALVLADKFIKDNPGMLMSYGGVQATFELAVNQILERCIAERAEGIIETEACCPHRGCVIM